MIHDGRCVGLPLVDYLETKANIVALSNLEEGMTAYASDTNQFGAYDGSAWHWSRLDIDYLTGATYVSVQDWTNIVQSAGYFDGGDLTAHSDAITAANVGGAGAGSFEVAGDQTAGYPAAATITVSGSTGNDGDYTVSAGGATHAGGTTTIPVDEAVADGTADGDIANGRMDGAAIKGFLKTTDAALGDTKSFDLAATANFALTDANTNYIYIDFVSGPRWQATTTRANIEQYRQFPVGRVYRDGTTLHIAQSGSQLEDFVRREHERTIAVRGYERASGGVISETGERYLESTAGVFYLGMNKIITTGVDTSGAATFRRWYHSGGVWTSDLKSQICQGDVYQYDNGTDLANMTLYGVWWVYIHYDSDINVVVGRGNYTLANALAATVPTTPHFVSDFSILAAKIIVKFNGTNFYSNQSAYDVQFQASCAVDHNDLGSLQGGIAAEYYHTTSAQHTAAFGDKTANHFYAGPAAAPAAAPGFRAMVAADIQTIAGIAWTQAHTFDNTVQINSPAAASVPFTVKLAASQSANAIEVRSSAGAIQSYFNEYGNLNIGATGDARHIYLRVNQDDTANATVQGLDIDIIERGTGNLTGVSATVRKYSASNITSLVAGQFIVAPRYTTATISSVYGIQGQISLVDAADNTPTINTSYALFFSGNFFRATVGTAYGLITSPGNISTGSITTASAGYFRTSSISSTGTITDSYGCRILQGTIAGVGTLTNLHGLYIGDMNTADTLNYAIYTNVGLIRFGDDVVMADGKNVVFDTTTGTEIATAIDQKLAFWGATPIVQPTALTAQLTTITHTAPGTPDYAVQDFVDVSLGAGWAFADHDEANTVLSAIANLQVRLAELETKAQALGLVA